MGTDADKSYPPPPGSFRIEQAPRTELQELQNVRLKALIRRAWEHVPFYRERWKEAGLRPEDIEWVEDLTKLPVVSKKDLEDDLLAHPPFGSYQGDFPAIRFRRAPGLRAIRNPFSTLTAIGASSATSGPAACTHRESKRVTSFSSSSPIPFSSPDSPRPRAR